MNDAKPSLKFRAYADYKKHYYVEVRVFKTLKDMRSDIRRETGKGAGLALGQVTQWFIYDAATYEVVKYETVKGRFAVMWLHEKTVKNQLLEVVAHECTHAAIAYTRIKGENAMQSSTSPEKGEEVTAYAVGRLNRAIMLRLIKEGVFE